jgi:hypothetical protein
MGPRKRKCTSLGYSDWEPRYSQASVNRLKDDIADQNPSVGRLRESAPDELHQRSENSQGVQTDSIPEPEVWSSPLVESDRYHPRNVITELWDFGVNCGSKEDLYSRSIMSFAKCALDISPLCYSKFI